MLLTIFNIFDDWNLENNEDLWNSEKGFKYMIIISWVSNVSSILFIIMLKWFYHIIGHHMKFFYRIIGHHIKMFLSYYWPWY